MQTVYVSCYDTRVMLPLQGTEVAKVRLRF